jgi:hypothetical protein
MVRITCQDDIDLRDLLDMQPALMILFSRAFLYANEHQLPFRITSLISDRANVKSVSKTHEDGRAFDISVRGWSAVHIEKFVFMMNRDYADIAAISYTDHKPRAVVYHDYKNQGSHLHFQVRSNVNINKYIKE